MSWRDKATKIDQPSKSSWRDRATPVETLPELEKFSKLDSFGRALAQGGTFGFADEITSGLEAVGDTVFGDRPLNEIGDAYRDRKVEAREIYDQAQKQNPYSYGAGELTGAVGTAFVPGLNLLNAAKGARLAGVAGKAALAGGAYGLGDSEGETLGENLIDTAQGALLGAGGGALGVAASKGASKLANSKVGKYLMDKAAGWFDDVAEFNSARALGLERGTRKNFTKQQIKDIGRYGLDSVDPKTGKKILSPFANTDDLVNRSARVQAEAGEKIGGVVDEIDASGFKGFSPLDTAAKVDDELGGFYRDPINRSEARLFDNAIESILMRGDGNIPLADAQTLKKTMGKVANWKNKVNITEKETLARNIYKTVSNQLDDAAEAGAESLGKPELLDDFLKAKKTYTTSKGSDDLLYNKVAREEGNKMFSLTDKILASTGVGATSLAGPAGAALTVGALGTKKFAEKYGNQLSAITSNKLANFVRQAPETLGKYAEPLRKAMERGGTSLAVTHHMLSAKDPEYRKLMQQDEEAED